MGTPSLQDRLARTKRTQARALAGEAAPVQTGPAANDSHLGDSAAGDSVLLVPFERGSHLAEFEELLPVMAGHYGYSGDDVACMRSAVGAAGPATPGANLELLLCVRQWRIDIVTFGLREQLAPGAGGRAWIQFRQSVMGMTADEAGQVYAEDALLRPIDVPAVPGGSARHTF